MHQIVENKPLPCLLGQEIWGKYRCVRQQICNTLQEYIIYTHLSDVKTQTGVTETMEKQKNTKQESSLHKAKHLY